ncbi:MAG: hypothetical protein HRU15_06410 [Planctomycetes bacterium]|nr:hypothetical protein [Planctomycetota bacterium]
MTAKIWTGVIVVIIAFVTTVTLGCYFGLQTEEDLNKVNADLFPATIQAYEMRNLFKKSIEKYDIGAIYLADEDEVNAADELMTEVQSRLQILLTNNELPAQQQTACHNILKKIQDWQKQATPLYIRQANDEARENDEAVLPQLYESKESIALLIDGVVDATQAYTQSLIKQSEESSIFQRWSSVSIMAGSLLLCACIMTLIINKGIRNPINEVVRSLQQSGGSVSDVSNQVLHASESVKSMTGIQAEKISAISVGIEEITQMTKSNTVNARGAEDQADLARSTVQKGLKAMGEMSRMVSKIKDDADKMNSIIKSIEDIAFKTNLLALNAAVEAARAGEAGRGFAVVAEEVRSLAGACAEAANSTNQLISSTVSNIDQSVNAAENVGAYFSDIDQSVEQLGAQAREVSSATQQEAIALGTVNDDLNQVDELTKTTNDQAQNSLQLGQGLLYEAQQLQSTMEALEGIISGIRQENDNNQLLNVAYDNHIESDGDAYKFIN